MALEPYANVLSAVQCHSHARWKGKTGPNTWACMASNQRMTLDEMERRTSTTCDRREPDT